MNAQIVFLTLFLGLASGIQPIDLHIDGPVKVVRIVSGSRELARLSGPPWHANVDLGPLAPQELVAIGLDEHGQEIARTSQLLNLPRATAELEMAMENEGKDVVLRWHHLMNLRPASASLTLDGAPLALDGDLRAALPKLDPLLPHVLSAKIRFDDGFTARKELLIEGIRSDSTGTELTPVLLWRKRGRHPAGFAGCFSVDGAAVRASAVEKPPAIVTFVQEPFPDEFTRRFEVFIRAQSGMGTKRGFQLPDDTSERLLWPIAETYGDDASSSILFARSTDLPASTGGMLWLLTQHFDDQERIDDPRRFADAVAVAGLNAVAGGFRRAVVLVVGSRKDVSRYDARSVRHYLDALGVPLFVWSIRGPRPDLADSWGEVEDISNAAKLDRATDRLRRVLDAERVAWLAVDPLDALHVEVKANCELQPTR